MDAKDVRIFCEMAFKYLDYSAFEKRHVSALEIGKKLGMDEKTVRGRVRKMEEEGFIKYYQAIPNLTLLGLGNIGMYSFEAPDIASKRPAISAMLRSKSIVEVFDMLGPAFTATLVGPSAEMTRESAEELGKVAGLKNVFRISDRLANDPLCELGELDWQIIRELRYDALKPARTIALRLSVTPRMVEYRIERLLRCKALFMRALIDARRQAGLLFYGLLIFADSSKQSKILSQVSSAMGDKLWSSFAPAPGVLIANLFAFSIGEPEEEEMRVLKMEGVNRCNLSLFKEALEPENPSWIDASISEKADSRGRKG